MTCMRHGCIYSFHGGIHTQQTLFHFHGEKSVLIRDPRFIDFGSLENKEVKALIVMAAMLVRVAYCLEPVKLLPW